MAHPYAKHAADKVGHRRAEKYQSGGSVRPSNWDFFTAGAKDFADNVRGAVTGNHPPDMGFANRRRLLTPPKTGDQ